MQLGPEEGALPGLQRGVVLDYHTSRARQRLWAAGFCLFLTVFDCNSMTCLLLQYLQSI